MLSGTIAGLAGVMFSSLNGPSLNFGGTLLLPAFAAAFLGSTQLTPGRFNVWGTLLAIYVLATGVQGLQLVSGASWLSDMFNGVALILAVALSIKRSPSALGQRIRARLRRAAPPHRLAPNPEPSWPGEPGGAKRHRLIPSGLHAGLIRCPHPPRANVAGCRLTHHHPTMTTKEREEK